MTTALTTRIHLSESGNYPPLGERWDACLSACPADQQIFRYNWYRAWNTAYASGPPWTGETAVVEAVSADGSPTGFLPLARRRQAGLRILSLAGFYQPMRSFPCITESAPAACEAIAKAIASPELAWDLLRLGPIDTATPERLALVDALEGTFQHTFRIPRGRTIVNALRDSMDAYSAQKSVKRIRSYERKFLRVAGAEISHVEAPSGDAADRILAELGVIESRSWLATRGGDLRFVAARDQAFWRDVCDTVLSPAGAIDIWIAHVGDTPLAYRVVLRAGDTDFMIANQFDESAAEHRLGWILYLRHLELAVSRGTRFIDSAPGDIHYKGRLGGEEAAMRFDLCVLPNTLKGAALAAALRGLHGTRRFLDSRPWGKRLAAKLPRV